MQLLRAAQLRERDGNGVASAYGCRAEIRRLDATGDLSATQQRQEELWALAVLETDRTQSMCKKMSKKARHPIEGINEDAGQLAGLSRAHANFFAQSTSEAREETGLAQLLISAKNRFNKLSDCLRGRTCGWTLGGPCLPFIWLRSGYLLVRAIPRGARSGAG